MIQTPEPRVPTGFKLLEVLALLLMATCAVTAITVLTAILFPYNPLTIDEFYLEPESVCAGDTLRPVVTYYFEDESFADVNTIDLRSAWIAVDVPEVETDQRFPDGSDVIPASEVDPVAYRTESVSGRYVPPRPGVWQLESIYTVRGERWEVPVSQQVTVYSSTNVQIVPREECES